MLNSTKHEVSKAHQNKNTEFFFFFFFFFAFKLSDVVHNMLINVTMPTIVGISTFMSLINFMLS